MNIKKILLISGLILNGSLFALNDLGGLDDISEITAFICKKHNREDVVCVSQNLLLKAYLQGFRKQEFNFIRFSYADVAREKPKILRAAYDFGASKSRSS